VKRWDLEEDLELVTQVFYIRGRGGTIRKLYGWLDTEVGR
jgi:hypothetical protein